MGIQFQQALGAGILSSTSLAVAGTYSDTVTTDGVLEINDTLEKDTDGKLGVKTPLGDDKVTPDYLRCGYRQQKRQHLELVLRAG